MVFITEFTHLPIWEQINKKAQYSPIHFFIAANCHDWKLHYPYILLKATQLTRCGKETKYNTRELMVDSLGMDLTVEEQVKLQKEYDTDFYITRDEFQNPKKTTQLTLKYLKEIIKQDILLPGIPLDVMLIIQGESPQDYIAHFNDLLIIAANSDQCTDCQNNLDCRIIFRQSLPKKIKATNVTYQEYHDNLYVPTETTQGFRFTFGIGGLIQRKVAEQKEIIESVISYGIKKTAAVNYNVFTFRDRRIMTDTVKGETKLIKSPRIQFHILGVGASKQIFPTLMKNQPYILSFDTRTPSKMSILPNFFDKHLRRYPRKKAELELLPLEDLTFRQKIDDVGDISALNTLRTFYNVAMILYAMESNMKLLEENKDINMIKRFIKFPSPIATKITKTLEEFLPERKVRATRSPKILLGEMYKKKRAKGMTAKQIIEEALIRWTSNYEETGEMATSLAILNGLIIFGTLTITEVIANIPFIKSPQAAMNVITAGYKITEYPICEDTPDYAAYKKAKTQPRVPKEIQIREKYLDLVLKYLLKDPSLIDEYKKEKGW